MAGSRFSCWFLVAELGFLQLLSGLTRPRRGKWFYWSWELLKLVFFLESNPWFADFGVMSSRCGVRGGSGSRCFADFQRFFSYGVLSSLARVDEPVRKAVGVFLQWSWGDTSRGSGNSCRVLLESLVDLRLSEISILCAYFGLNLIFFFYARKLLDDLSILKFRTFCRMETNRGVSCRLKSTCSPRWHFFFLMIW